MLERARQRLVPTDGIERHVLSARLLGRPASVIDVGGIRGHLAAELPGARVTAVNVDAEADVVIEPGPHPLPFPDDAAEAVASLDTLEHIPRADRPLFVDEILRIAQSRVVLCCPLGTPERRRIEEADNAWYRSLTGHDHPWIGEHLQHGVPTQPELEELFAKEGWSISFRFSGDARATSRQFRVAERSVTSRRPIPIARWIVLRTLTRPDLTLRSEPSSYSNRVFVIAERQPRPVAPRV